MERSDVTLESTASDESAGPDDREVLPFRAVIGDSRALRRAIGLARKVAEHPATTVLLHGETGTGKELFARGIHYASAYPEDAFVAINCSAIPENLLESELFGHEKGSFTDARSTKRGLLELAGRGTVFLDEVSELPPNLQPKLLRVLEEKHVRRLGGLEEHEIACRVIAATNRDLSAAVGAGEFREDLYYRLNVFRVALPPLRERRDDIEHLARHFVERMCREKGLKPPRLAADALRALHDHAWPGNVRELKNVMERAIIMADESQIGAEHIMIQQRSRIPAAEAADSSSADTIRVPSDGLTLEEMERRLVNITLRLADDNQTRAAEMLGVSRPTVIRKMRKYGLK